jgi:hypothetical protein
MALPLFRRALTRPGELVPNITTARKRAKAGGAFVLPIKIAYISATTEIQR